MTDKLSERLGKRQWRYEHTSIDRDEWDELVALEQRVERLEEELRGEIARTNRAIELYNVLASQEEDLDKLTAQQKPNEQAMEEA